MSSSLTYKCDDCGKGLGFEDSTGMVRIEIEQRGPYPYHMRTLIHRDYCQQCWEKRAPQINEATK